MSNYRVMVTDDDNFTLVMYKNIFNKSDAIQLDCYSQGEEAVAATEEMQRNGESHALALIDMRIPPGIDGLETAVRIRKINPEIQLAFVSGYNDSIADKISAALEGKVLWFAKPFKSSELYQAVYECCLTGQWGEEPSRLYAIQ